VGRSVEVDGIVKDVGRELERAGKGGGGEVGMAVSRGIGRLAEVAGGSIRDVLERHPGLRKEVRKVVNGKHDNKERLGMKVPTLKVNMVVRQMGR
jgi:hypothetical protein